MPDTPRMLVTDLDGTLLDHDSYDYAAARPCIEHLDELGWPLVLSSSKTASEMKALREALGNSAPFVVENGSAIFIPEGAFGAKGIGEIVCIPTAPAIANAFFRYDGVRRYSLPLKAPAKAR